MDDTEEYVDDGNPAGTDFHDRESAVDTPLQGEEKKLHLFLERIDRHSSLMASLMQQCNILVKDREIVLEVPNDLSEQVDKELKLNRKNADFIRETVQNVFSDHFEILFRHPIPPELKESFNRKLDMVLDLFDGKILD